MPRKSIGAAMAQTRRPVKDNTPAWMFKANDALAARQSAGDSLTNLISGLGTGRDKRAHNFYGFPRPLTRWELENMWRSSWLCKRIIKSKVDDSCREWREFDFEDGDTKPRIDALCKAEKDMHVVAKFVEAQYWSELYGGALMVMGTSDVKKPEDMMLPLDPTTVKKDGLKWMHVLDRWRCSAGADVERDLTSPNFGLPQSYQISDTSLIVHHSRVIRFNGEKLPYYSWTANAMWDDSAMQHVMDSLSDCDAVTQGIASMVFEANVDVLTAKGIETLLTTKDGVEKIRQRFLLAMEMKSNTKTLLINEGDTYEKKSNNFANLDKVLEKIQDNVCGASETPRSRLFGTSPGGLNSTGDNEMNMYYENIKARQVHKQGPKVDQFDEIFVRSVLGTMPDDFSYKWRPLQHVGDSEQSTIDYQNAQRDQIYVQMGAVDEGLVAGNLKEKGVYPGMSDDDVKMAQELAQAPEPVPVIVAPPQPAAPKQEVPANQQVPTPKPPTQKAPAKK